MRHFAIASACGAGLLCLTLGAKAAEPQDAKTETLKGVIVEKRANVKSFEAWNAPSDPYYVLALDIKTGDKRTKRHVTLRPSKSVSTADLKKHRSLEVSVHGHFVKGKVYKPSGVESFPIEIDSFPIEALDPLKADAKIEKPKTRPARRGSGFVVTAIVKAKK